MKFMTLLVAAAALTLGGCAGTDNRAQNTAVKGEESYVSLGSNIPRKGPRRAEDQTVDMQQLENSRIQNNGVNNGGH